MTSLLVQFLWVCGGPLICLLTGCGVVYSAWRLARRDNGWDR